jgi:hypothetical protein
MHQVEGEAVVIIDEINHRKRSYFCRQSPAPGKPTGFTPIGREPLGPRIVNRRRAQPERDNSLLMMPG